MRLLSLLLLLCLSAGGASVSLIWDNSPDPTVIATRIYWGTASSNWTNFVSVPMPTNTVTVSNLLSGTTYYFVAIATDGVSNAVPSNEASTHIPPDHPNNLRIKSVQ